MNDLLSNPAIQSGVIPLIVAIVAALLFKRIPGLPMGLSFGVAYYLSVYLAVGFQIYPFSSSRKIIILGVVAIVLGTIIDANKLRIRKLAPQNFVIVFAVLATIWLIWPTLSQGDSFLEKIFLLSTLLYTALITRTCYQARQSPERGAMIALALGLGTGISAILGASALVGQLGIAIGAIAGGFLLLALFNQSIALGATFMLPVGILASLLGVSAVLYASLPWYCLLPLAALPLTAYVQIPTQLAKIKLLIMLAAITLPPAVIAIALAWFSTSGEESMY